MRVTDEAPFLCLPIPPLLRMGLGQGDRQFVRLRARFSCRHRNYGLPLSSTDWNGISVQILESFCGVGEFTLMRVIDRGIDPLRAPELRLRSLPARRRHDC